MPYTLKILNSKDYNKIAERYPAKQRNRIKDSWGFTDTKRKVAFVRTRRNVADMAGTAMHEVVELLSDVSPHDEAGIRLKGKKEPKVEFSQPPPPEFALSPEQKQMWEQFTLPFITSQFNQYKNIFTPATEKLGGQLTAQLDQPLSLPENIWENIWTKTKERQADVFAPVEKRATERFAGTGALESSGQVQKFFGDVDLAKAKGLEDLAVDQAIAEWNEKKIAKQGSIENMFRFLSGTPSFGGVPQSTVTQAIPTIPGGGEGPDFGSIFGGAAGGAGLAAMLGLGAGTGGIGLLPWAIAMGLGGGLAGSMATS